MRLITLCTFFIFFSIGFLPISTEAQYSSRVSSSYRSKINELDDDPVKNLPVPILFGVARSMITPNFGDPRDGGDREHEGLDIMAPKGAPIVSPTEAVVVRTGTGSGSGKYVTTANPGGESFVYMHLSEILVENGDELGGGDLIGYVGNTGNASGGAPHLHLEIRSSRRATDPYPRITEQFSLKQKINFLNNALADLNDEDDEEALVDFVVKTYQSELWLAKNSGIKLATDVDRALQKAPVAVGPSAGSGAALPPGDLDLGSQGPLVVTLQAILIAKATGPAALALKSASATGYFGPITQRALIEYQVAHGITPAIGYFGPKTRAYILANG